MRVYIELIFIINFLLDFIILYGTKRLLKINKSIKRILLSSSIGSLMTFILFLNINNIELFIIKIIFSMLLIVISFGYNNFFNNIFYFYLISIIIGGCMYLFDIYNNLYLNYILLIIISPIVIRIIIREKSNYKLNINNKYIVDIIINNKEYKLEGFIDTGNRLIDPISKCSVILTNIYMDYKKCIFVPYKALNSEGIIPCVRAESITINNKVINNYLIGINNDKFNIDGMSCILPNKLREDI